MGQISPNSHFSAFSTAVALRAAISSGCGSIFKDGFEVDAGGIGQSFLNSNKFSDIFPASDHGVPA